MASRVNYKLGDPIFLIEESGGGDTKYWRVALSEAGARSALKATRWRRGKVYRVIPGEIIPLTTEGGEILNITGEEV